MSRERSGRLVGSSLRQVPYFGRVRQADAGGPLSREEFEQWAAIGPLTAAPGARVYGLYQRLCPDLTPDERLEISLAVDRIKRGLATRADYDAIVARIRARLWGAPRNEGRPRRA